MYRRVTANSSAGPHLASWAGEFVPRLVELVFLRFFGSYELQ